jgi:4-carboxymuconolactone decarboxylase
VHRARLHPAALVIIFLTMPRKPTSLQTISQKNGDRMPPIPRARMSKAQKEAVDELAAGPRGRLVGPFIAAVRSPEFMRRLQKLGEYLRYQSVLEPRLVELAILITARIWTQQFEWDTHAPLAAKAGLHKEKIAAIAHGRRPPSMDEQEEVVYDFLTELQHNHSVSDSTYEQAVKAFGEQGVIDLTGTLGYYSTLAMIMNVARTPSPGTAQVLAQFPN